MGVLLGANIGQNYKGILNLNTLNGNLTTTLEAITDGDGNASTLLLSTTLARVSSNLTIGGSTTASARLHVRGDGTNPIGRFEDNTGSACFIVESNFLRIGASAAFGPLIYAMSGTSITNTNNGTSLGLFSQFNIVGTTDRYDFAFGGNAVVNTSGTVSHVALVKNFTAGAGSANYRPLSILYTINNSGAQTGTATGIFLNATETALNGMGHNLMDLQRGGVSQFRVDRSGNVILPTGTRFIVNPDYALGIFSSGIHNMTFQGAGGAGAFFEFRGNNGSNLYATFRQTSLDLNTITLITLGGITNAFPAIKRNGAAIDFRLADDSAFCNIQANNATLNRVLIDLAGVAFQGATNTTLTPSSNGWTLGVNAATNSFHFGRTGSFDTRQATAMVQIDSTTQGFLPPRMTTTQKNAITTPATGLVLYDSTLNKLCVYTGSAWETITSV